MLEGAVSPSLSKSLWLKAPSSNNMGEFEHNLSLIPAMGIWTLKQVLGRHLGTWARLWVPLNLPCKCTLSAGSRGGLLVPGCTGWQDSTPGFTTRGCSLGTG